MNIIEMNITDIKPYKNNPRINKRAIGVVAESIKEFGFKNPIVVDSNNEIIVGHTRLEASKLLGLEVVPVIVADDLSEEQVKAFRIMDNKLSEFAEGDYTKLLEEIEELRNEDYDIDLTGFNEAEIGEMIDSFIEEEEEKAEENKPELEFTKELLEEYQYVVLYFDNTLDWIKAKSVLGLDTVKALRSKGNYERVGTRRIIKGNDIIDRLGGE